MIDLVIMLATPVVFHHLKINLQFCGGKVLAQHHAELLPATTSPRREPGHRPLQWRNDLRPGEGWASLHAKPTLGVIHSIPLRKMHGSLQEMMGKESLNYTILETRFNIYIYCFSGGIIIQRFETNKQNSAVSHWLLVPFLTSLIRPGLSRHLSEAKVQQTVK